MGRRALPFRTALSALAAMAAWPAAAAPATEAFCGYAYGLDNGRYRYTELHRQQIDNGRWLGGTIEYVGPDGRRIGRKTLAFDRNPFIPVYRLELYEGRYVEGIEQVEDGRVTAYRKEFGDAEVTRRTIPWSAPAAADSGFHALIRAHLATILAGERKRFDFIVAGGLDYFRFRVHRAGDARFEDRAAALLRAEPDSLLRLMVRALELTYEPATGQLLEYRGPTNLRDENGDGYDVRIVFASRVPEDAPAAAVTACSAPVREPAQ